MRSVCTYSIHRSYETNGRRSKENIRKLICVSVYSSLLWLNMIIIYFVPDMKTLWAFDLISRFLLAFLYEDYEQSNTIHPIGYSKNIGGWSNILFATDTCLYSKARGEISPMPPAFSFTVISIGLLSVRNFFRQWFGRCWWIEMHMMHANVVRFRETNRWIYGISSSSSPFKHCFPWQFGLAVLQLPQFIASHTILRWHTSQ